MLVGDIYGGLDYAKIGLSATTIASSFGRVVSDRDKVLSDYEPADMALALMRMVSYNIGHLAYLNATRYGIKRCVRERRKIAPLRSCIRGLEIMAKMYGLRSYANMPDTFSGLFHS